jgi:hypothetical protein
MKRRNLTLLILSLILSIYFSSHNKKSLSAKNGPHNSYLKQLNELNYLIMKTSAVNIIYGLNLSREQAVKLKRLSAIIDNRGAPIPDMKGDALPELVEVKKVFQELFHRLLYRKKLSESFKKKVKMTRILETGIIRKSIAGSKRFGYRGKGCLKCHAPSSYFPSQKASQIKLKNISPGERERIDRAHLLGFFGQRGAYELWNMKSKVSEILTSSQKYMMNSVNCSLIPPDHLANPTRIGQAILSGDWYNYFDEIRSIGKDKWKTYRKLYFHIPFGDFVSAISPGLSAEKKKEVIKRMGALIEQVRVLDDIDYQLKKEKLVSDLTAELDRLQGTISSRRSRADLNRYRMAMFLLFPNNRVIYDELIKNIDAGN